MSGEEGEGEAVAEFGALACSKRGLLGDGSQVPAARRA